MTNFNQLITEHLDIWTSAVEKKSSSGRGNSGAVSLHGITKLRELILELAIRGKLVSQDEKDEPADVLLQRIENSTDEKLKERKKRGQTTSDEAKPLFSAPVGWSWTPLSGVASVIRGVTYKKSDAISSEKTGYVPLLRGNNIGRTLNYDELVFVPKNLVKEEQLVRQGDIVIAMSSGSANLVGKASQSNDNIQKTFGAFCGVVRPLSSELNEFFRFFFQTPLYRNATQAAGKGIGINNLNKSVLERLWVPLPPLEEQHRIVAKVDELMALCDALERQAEDSLKAHQTLVETCLATLTNSQSPEELTQNWTRIEAHFDTLFTTEDSLSSLWKIILKLAIRGSLVPQNETEGSASQLLRSIAAKKEVLISNGRLRKSKALKVINEDEAPFTLPNGWAWSRLNDFIDVRDGTHDSPKDANGTNTFPLVTSKNFKNGDIDFDSARRISAADHFEISKRSRVEQDDILFSMIGGNLGNQVMVRTDEDFSVKNVALFKYYDKTQSIPEFVKLYMENLAVDLQSQASGGAQPFVSLGFLRNLMIGVPPIGEQERIVAKARELERLIELTSGRISISTASSVELADTLTSKIH